ncbi:Ribonuclease T2 Precursor-like protein [Sarcoptes scabiei]|uniref:Ribonuclease T2-like protein n=1 Tax=Sarcoptes scabiei TaxID=52283 RepID=A0A132A7Y7_SARSC|nr:Ribonuclease T2 Precursor-like protein [Sarcoptes scabiei]
MISLSEILCPASQDNRTRLKNWFFICLITLNGFMVVFVLIGLMAGLWKPPEPRTAYFILARQWPITSCIGKKCIKIEKPDWIISEFVYKLSDDDPNTKRKCNGKEFDEDFFMKTIEKEKIRKRWPSLNPIPTKNDAADSSPTKESKTDSKKSEDKSLDTENIKLWKDQWETNGRCSNQDQLSFFSKALELDSKYSLTNNDLLLGKYQPDYDRQLSIANLTKDFHSIEKFKSFEDEMIEFVCKMVQFEQTKYFIQEIRLCFDAEKFEPIKCYDKSNYNKLSAFNCFDSSIIYYPS